MHFLKLKSSMEPSVRRRKKHLEVKFSVKCIFAWKARTPTPTFAVAEACPVVSSAWRHMCSY